LYSTTYSAGCTLTFCIQQTTSRLKRVCSTTDVYIIYSICNISIPLFWFISHESHNICNIYDSVSFDRYCILNEVWRLVADGILNVTDIDNVMSEGLGMRYAFLGPLETAHLNAEGVRECFFNTMTTIQQQLRPNQPDVQSHPYAPYQRVFIFHLSSLRIKVRPLTSPYSLCNHLPPPSPFKVFNELTVLHLQNRNVLLSRY